MKNILASILVLLLHSGAFATTYYVSLAGNDGDGKSLANAWKSIAKLNASSSLLVSGDTVKFRSGDTFFGTITPTKSGTSSAQIIYTTTASGMATITGFYQSAISWPAFTSAGIYTATTTFAPQTEPNIIVRNEQVMEMGRYPNVGDANTDGGYITITSVPTGNTSTLSKYTDSTIRHGGGSWVGAYHVLRVKRYASSRERINAQTTSGSFTTFSYDPASANPLYPEADFGFYFIKSLRTLDRDGEWYYNDTANRLSIYATSSSSLSSVKIPVVDNLFKTSSISYLKVINLDFEGANVQAAYISGGSNISFEQCKFNFSGTDHVYFTGHLKGSVKNCDMNNSMVNGVRARGGSNLTSVIGNKIYNCGVNLSVGDGQGVYFNAVNGNIENNDIQNIGKIGILFGFPASNVTMKNNYVANTCIVIDDAGAIYTGAVKDDTSRNNCVVGNIIENINQNSYHGTPDFKGTTRPVSGIYIDNHANGVFIDRNTIINTPIGIQLHYPTNIIMTNNNIFGSSAKSYWSQNLDKSVADNVSYTHNVDFKNNNILQTGTGGYPVWIEKTATATYKDTVIGKIDNNKYFRPLAQSTMKLMMYAGGSSSYLFPAWQTAFPPWDKNTSALPPITYPSTDIGRFKVVYNATTSPQTYALDGKTWVDMASVAYVKNSVTLLPYASVMLMQTPSVPLQSNGAPSVSITAPAANAGYTLPATVDIAASASDPDGIITKVEFYSGSTLLYTDTVSPYSYRWAVGTAGNYTITAKATDNGGLSTTSSAVPISVNPIAAPTVSMTSPANNASYTAPATIDMSASASSGSKIIKVEFFSTVGTTSTLLFADSAAPYAYTWKNVPAGNYTLTAKATDSLSKTATSGGVAVTVATGNNAPSVSLTAPLDSATYTSPATVSLSAIATDDGSVSSVKFYNGSTLIATGTLSTVYANTYTATWLSVPTGKYNITAIATDNLGATKTSAVASINVGASLAPKVTMTSPINGASFYVTDSVLLAATATDDGRVDSVVFYSNGVRLWRETTAPYEKKFKFAAGTYTFTAIAYDNSLLSTTSGSVSITVKTVPANQPPQVNISGPLSGAVYTSPATIDITAVASDADGTIASVTFYNGSTQLFVDNTAPYTFQWTGIAAGNYNITAKAVDNLGLATTSSTVSIAVNPPPQYPTVAITAPINNAVYTTPASIDISASASDPDGTIQRVEFYSDNTLLFTDNTFPYSYTWSGATVGNYKITAKAFDNSGLSSTSGIANISVNAPANVKPSVSISAPADNSLVIQPANLTITAIASDVDGTVKKVNFYNNSTILFTATNPADFSYTYNSIPEGNYRFFAVAVDDRGDSTFSAPVNVVAQAANVAPKVGITAPSNNAAYLAPANVNITVSSVDVDGTVNEVRLYNGTTLLATGSVDTLSNFTYLWPSVAAGSYNLTAVATDDKGASTTSVPVSISVRNLVAPQVSITAPANNATYLAPATVAIAATASDPDGTVKKVEFYRGTTLISADTTAPYTASAASLAAGTYQLTAKAFDNDNQSTVSASVNIVVNAPKTPPSVAMTSPANNSSFGDTVAVKLTANASDLDGTVKKVDFYDGTTLIASSATSPYSAIWTNMSAGAHSITAKATDNDNLVTASAPITVNIVHKNILPSVSIISPQNNAIAYKKTATTLLATATDPDGTIIKVEFYVKSTLIGQSTAAPYSTTWSAAVTGAYTITAKAYDNNGGVTTSSPITVNVTDKPIRISGTQIIIVQ